MISDEGKIEEKTLFSLLDVILLSLSGLGFIYFFYPWKKEETVIKGHVISLKKEKINFENDTSVPMIDKIMLKFPHLA